MNYENIGCELEFIGHIGQGISTEKKLKIELSLRKIQQIENYDSLRLWGRVNGISKDYYIAQTIRYQGFKENPEKLYLWAYDTFNWQPLPQVAPHNIPTLSRLNNYFEGQHDKIVAQLPYQMPSQITENMTEEEKIIARGNQQEPLKEIDRLSYLVQAIEFDCAVVPNESIKTFSNEELRPNRQFRGLSYAQATDLSQYRHFRRVNPQTKIEILSKNHSKDVVNYFDQLTKDLPSGCWKVTEDFSGLKVFLQNQNWPGFLAYNRINSPVYGYAYFGDGRKQQDLCFLLN